MLFLDAAADFSPLLRAVLEGYGHHVRPVPGAAEARELLGGRPSPALDVVLLD
jgi:hypothetical protein